MRNLVRLFLGIAMLIIFTQPSWAEDKTCTTSGCLYQVPLDRTGFYIAVVTLPSGQPEGVWSLLMNPGRAQPYYGGGFFAGGTLKEHSQFGSWIGFSLAEGEPVTIKPTNYTDNQAPVQIRLDKGISDGGRALVADWALRTPGQTFTTQTLDPGFYVISVLSQPNALNNTFFGLDLGAPSIYGGVVGGWLDSQPGSAGYGAFYLASPQTMDFQLMFDGDYGTGGAGQPYLEIYYQKEDGTREVYWSAPKQDSVGEVIEPTIPVVLPEPAVLPPDPGEAGKATLEGIDSDKDGVRDDVQRYIAATYPNPEDKPFRAALREYAAFQQPFLMEADDKFKTIANAENRAKQIDCVLYLHPEDGQAGLVNLRAEYLNTESRSRAYLNADGQLGGQPISLTPLEDLPQLCQKFTTRSATVVTRSLRQGANCKKDTGTVISLSNGAMTDAESAQRELTMLRTHVEGAKASSAISGEKLSYVATYNSTKSWINRLLNWVLPKLDEDSPKSTSKFWRWLGNTEQPPQTFIDVSLDTANDPAFVVPQELQSHVGTYRTFIDEGRKVVAVAHAEGNLYVDQAYENLDEDFDLRARKHSFGAVSIASSVRVGGSSCAMAVAGSAVAMAGGGCTNLQTDAVIGATSTADSSVSIANSVVHTLPGFVQDPLDHSFLSYLEGDISGPKIVNDVITAIPKLTPSPIVSQGVITVRLEWGKQPDVDLHVYEPSGSHVFFPKDNKQGVSGYLDLDDRDGKGPEHYYAKCETLQPGLYKIAVDYFSGTGPEMARINISAGEIIRSYTVPLASAGTGASPIPVAIIKVTQDEQSGEFKFEILSQRTPDQGTTSSEPSSSENSQPATSENSHIDYETLLIAAQITDPQIPLGLIGTTDKETIGIFGTKDSQGRLTNINRITFGSQTDENQNLSITLDSNYLPVTMEFPDGSKMEFSHYTNDGATATFYRPDGSVANQAFVPMSVDTLRKGAEAFKKYVDSPQLTSDSSMPSTRSGTRSSYDDCLQTMKKFKQGLDALLWVGLQMASTATCAASASAFVGAAATGVGAVPALVVVVWACGSALINYAGKWDEVKGGKGQSFFKFFEVVKDVEDKIDCVKEPGGCALTVAEKFLSNTIEGLDPENMCGENVPPTNVPTNAGLSEINYPKLGEFAKAIILEPASPAEIKVGSELKIHFKPEMTEHLQKCQAAQAVTITLAVDVSGTGIGINTVNYSDKNNHQTTTCSVGKWPDKQISECMIVIKSVNQFSPKQALDANTAEVLAGAPSGIFNMGTIIEHLSIDIQVGIRAEGAAYVECDSSFDRIDPDKVPVNVDYSVAP